MRWLDGITDLMDARGERGPGTASEALSGGLGDDERQGDAREGPGRGGGRLLCCQHLTLRMDPDLGQAQPEVGSMGPSLPQGSSVSPGTAVSPEIPFFSPPALFILYLCLVIKAPRLPFFSSLPFPLESYFWSHFALSWLHAPLSVLPSPSLSLFLGPFPLPVLPVCTSVCVCTRVCFGEASA